MKSVLLLLFLPLFAFPVAFAASSTHTLTANDYGGTFSAPCLIPSSYVGFSNFVNGSETWASSLLADGQSLASQTCKINFKTYDMEQYKDTTVYSDVEVRLSLITKIDNTPINVGLFCDVLFSSVNTKTFTSSSKFPTAAPLNLGTYPCNNSATEHTIKFTPNQLDYLHGLIFQNGNYFTIYVVPHNNYPDPLNDGDMATTVINTIYVKFTSTDESIGYGNTPLNQIDNFLKSKLGGAFFGLGLFSIFLILIMSMATPKTVPLFTIILLVFMGLFQAIGFVKYPSWLWAIFLIVGIIIIFSSRKRF